MYLPVKFNDVFNFVWFRKKLYVNKASMGKCQLLNLNMVGIWIIFKTVHGKALGMRRGETNKKLLLRPVFMETWRFPSFPFLLIAQMVEVRVVQQKTAGEVIYSVIYSTSELTKRQVLQSFWNHVMSLRITQQGDEKSVTEEYGFKKEVLSNGPNSGTLSRDI